jgi:hypothetical protein
VARAQAEAGDPAGAKDTLKPVYPGTLKQEYEEYSSIIVETWNFIVSTRRR